MQPIRNPKSSCNRCGFEGPRNLFYRYDESNNLILEDNPSWVVNSVGSDKKEYSPKKFCPKCNYVNGSDRALEDARLKEWAAGQSEEELDRSAESVTRFLIRTNVNGPDEEARLTKELEVIVARRRSRELKKKQASGCLGLIIVSCIISTSLLFFSII